MSILKTIQEPIKNEMKEFNAFFKKYLKGKTLILNTIINYLLKQKGKQIRPMLVFMSANLVSKTNKSSYHAAALIELMHTATLVHDDVVDDSNLRRGFFSINAIWKNKIAVLLGDYLLARGLLLAVNNKEFELLKIMSKAVDQMSEGELIQIEKAKKLNIDEDTYFKIISKKTAALMVACVVSGVASVGGNAEEINRIEKFGEYLGIAFQIRDDLFDYQTNKNIGKPVGNDIKERKITLPFIYALNNCSPSEKRSVIKVMRKKNKNDNEIMEVIAFVKKHRGIEYATRIMNDYKNKALNELEYFDKNQANKSLTELIKYVVERKK